MNRGLSLRIGVGSLALVVSCLALPAQTTGETVPLGQRFSMYSAANEEHRTYLVHRPASYVISTARYPVIYVTDGNEHFQHVSATVDFLAAAGKIPAMLVVGIPNVVRSRDLLGQTAAAGPSRMLKFLTDELVPQIDHDYRTAPYRMIMGWSDGGAFALHAMIHGSGVFNGYIVVATATSDDPAVPANLRAYFEAHPKPTLNADVFMTADNGTGMNLSGAYEIASLMNQRAGRVRDLRFTFRRYADESHASVPLRSVQEGLRTIFDGWELDDAVSLYDKAGLAGIEQHFDALSQHFGFPVPVPADSLFAVFTRLEGTRNAEAEAVIKRAVELYPGNSTGLYYMARLYMRTDRKLLATETLRKLLQMSPNDGGALSLLKQMGIEPDAPTAKAVFAAKDLAKYAGRYGTPAVFTVEQHGDKLYGRTVEQEYELVPLSSSTFHYSANNVYSEGGIVAAKMDARGRVTSLVFDRGSELAKSK